MPKLIPKLIFGLIKLIFRDKTDIVLENLALRCPAPKYLPCAAQVTRHMNPI